jgi:signal peptidase I
VLLTYSKAILAALLIAWGVRTFIMEAYRIPNSGMSPALTPGDTVFVTKFDYAIRIPLTDDIRIFERDPGRGDLVVFLTGGRSSRETLKRVIGIPGDRIEVSNGAVRLNGKAISNVQPGKCGPEILPLVEAGTPAKTYPVCVEAPLLPERSEDVLKEGEFFVVPDLRSESALLSPPSFPTTAEDSSKDAWQRQDQMEHAWGVIKHEQILGRARWIWLSITPPQEKPDAHWTARIRWNRMLQRIE